MNVTYISIYLCIEKFKHLSKNLLHQSDVYVIIKTMPLLWQDNQLMYNFFIDQLLGHGHGLLIGNIRILIAMQQHGGWIIPGNILKRAILGKESHHNRKKRQLP